MEEYNKNFNWINLVRIMDPYIKDNATLYVNIISIYILLNKKT